VRASRLTQCVIVQAWGYEFVDELTWVKQTVNHRVAKSHGFYLQHAKETCFVGRKGKPPPGCQGNIGSDVIWSLRRGQSQKPEEQCVAAAAVAGAATALMMVMMLMLMLPSLVICCLLFKVLGVMLPPPPLLPLPLLPLLLLMLLLLLLLRLRLRLLLLLLLLLLLRLLLLLLRQIRAHGRTGAKRILPGDLRQA
jgi:hypothetical protein